MLSEPDIKVILPEEAFNDVYIPYLDCMSRTQIFYGGSGSGKSVFIAQRCIYDVLRGGRNYLVCRAVGKSIRTSVFNEVKKVITDWGLNSLFTINKTDFVITCNENGYQIVFIGLDDVEKVKSITPSLGVFTDIWVEEATEIDRNTLKNLYKRQRGGEENVPKRITLSFNPIMQTHFLYLEYFSNISLTDSQTEYKSDALAILKTWYVHNRFLTEDDRKDLENEPDKYYRDVYTWGNWGVLGHVIFTNWTVDDLSGMADQFTNRRNGLDFGFSSDPAALSRSHYDRNHKTIYIFDELYEYGLTNDILAAEILKIAGHDRVICDSAEPKSIAELRQYHVNAVPAVKGKDSVIFGIQWLQQQQIVIDAKCINTKNEFMQYKWKEDKNGEAIRQPVEHNNHIIDAARYAYEEDSLAYEVTMVDDPFANW